MADNVDKIFEEYIEEHADSEQIDFSTLLKNHPKLETVLKKKISSYKKIIAAFNSESSTTRTPELEGKIIGGCEILRIIGEGGMGVVYLGRQIELDRLVAIKVLRTLPGETRSVGRFHREAKSIARLNHPNIVPIYHIGEEEGFSYIVMSYVEGIQLNKLIEKLDKKDRTNFSPDKIKSIIEEGISSGTTVNLPKEKSFNQWACGLMAQLMDAVSYAHSQGVIHRDIKPSNIIITPDGKPVLLDFGLSRDELGMRMTVTGEFLGTPLYAAPELLLGQTKEVKPLIDVYSLGSTFYELFTSRCPYNASFYAKIIQEIRNREPDPPTKYNKSIPKELNTILLTAIHKEPKCRYQTVTDLKNDLQRFLTNKPIRAKHPSIVYRIRKLIRRRRRLVIGTALTLLFLTSIAAFYIYSQYQRAMEYRDDFIFSFENGLYSEAIATINDVLVFLPQRENIWFALGDYKVIKDSYSKLYLIRGSLQVVSGEFKEGIDSLEKSNELNTTVDTLCTLSIAHMLLGNLDASYKSLIKAMLRNSNHKKTLFWVGIYYALTNNYDEAQTVLNKANNIKSNLYGDVYNQYYSYITEQPIILALLYENTSKYNLALSVVKETLDKYPNSERMRYLLRNILLKSPKTLNYKNEFTHLIKLKPPIKYTFYGHDLTLLVPTWWWKSMGPSVYGNEFFAVFSRMPESPSDALFSPAIFIAHIKSNNISDNEIKKLLVRTVARYNGAINSINRIDIKRHPYKRYVLNANIEIASRNLILKSLVLKQNNNIYVVSGYLPEDNEQPYEKELDDILESVAIEKNNEWYTFKSPNNKIQLKFPETPIYYEGYSHLGLAESVKGDILVSGFQENRNSRFYGSFYELSSKTYNALLEAEIKTLVEQLKKMGELISINKINGYGTIKYHLKWKLQGKIYDELISLQKHTLVILEVQQYERSYDDEIKEIFFNSLKII